MEGIGGGWGCGFDGPRGRGFNDLRGRGGWNNRGFFDGRGRGRGNFRGRGGFPPRGFPPMFPWGRGRGGRWRGAFMPPGHPMAKGRPDFPDSTNMSMEEKLHRFCLFLRHEDSLKNNAIQTIMNGITSCKLGLKVDYQAEELTKIGGKIMYTGVLKLDTVFLARAIRPNKKDLKQEVFQKALNVMLSETVQATYNLVDPEKDAIKEELDQQVYKEKATDGEKTTKSVAGIDIMAMLQSIITVLKNMKNPPDNPISTLEQATTQAHSLIKMEYQPTPVVLSNSRQYFMAALTFGSTVVGQGWGVTKKEGKLNTYQSAKDRLETKTLDELGDSMEPIEIPETEHHLPFTAKANVSKLSIEERFQALVQALAGGATSPRQTTHNQIDVFSLQNNLIPMLVVRKAHENDDEDKTMIAELYIEKILIASVEGQKKRDCFHRVYDLAVDVLTSTPSEQILSQHKRITDEEVKDPRLLDLIIKGSARTVESNASALKRIGFKLDDVFTRDWRDLVILENQDWMQDRERNAFCILQFSCTQNNLLLQWECDCVEKYFRCMVSIQKQLMGESYGSNKVAARNLACADALFKLYETQEVLCMSQRPDDQLNWISYESIKEKAEKMRKESVSEEPIMKTDEEGNRLPNSFIMKALTMTLDEKISKQRDLREVVFGPGIELVESRELRSYGREKNLRSDVRQHQGQPYLIFYDKLDWQEIVKLLRTHSGPYGKFLRVDKATLPKHSDIENVVMKDLPMADSPPTPEKCKQS
ncbi:uncharacterized protein LOC127837159 isoform X2 [Dreissena polymorpha]|nr:uncharacterized protein LOC127837159 isoform X1 [Dreissena polymorpha]XP_052220029.1 uncharacterized protein LOC127837159 isoform X2 [Dreissena polymorpha]